jgi:DNA modification methylase
VRCGLQVQTAQEPIVLDDDLVVAGDNATVLAQLPDGAFDLIYMDPPFNTGRAQARHSLSVVADDVSGDRVGFGGRRYRSRLLQSLSYDDAFGDYLAFLEPRLARGKRPTDVWFHTIVPTNGREKTGYPTQKPEGVLRRIVAASSRPDGWCLDPFAGSGTLGAVCQRLGRRFVLVDSSPVAIEVMRARLLRGAVDERDELDRLELSAE